MGKLAATSSGKGGTKKKPTRQASLLRKPVVEVRGKLGKPQKSKKKKLKKIGASSADFYEAKVDGDREKTTREESRVINAAPKNLDQEMPKKLRMLLKAQKEAAVVEKLSNSQKKARQLDKYKKQQESVNSWFKRPVAKIPKFERKPGESDRAYYGRVEHESNDFMKIARFENENEVKVVQKENGEIEVEKRAKRKQIKNKEFREKKKAKKLKTLNEEADVRDFSDLTDEVKFNERNERPPEDLARPRKATEKTNKAEKLASFKFMGLMGSTIQSDKKKSEPVKSLAYKERMSEERQRVIDMYRNIKAKKRTGIVT